LSLLLLQGFTIPSPEMKPAKPTLPKSNNCAKEKDNSIQGGDDSPFGDSIEFNGLKYFPIDAKYRINARLTEIDQKKPLSLPTSDGKQKSYLEYAYAEFELDGVKSKLLILEIMDMGPYRGTLFLAFADKTSADETYGAGPIPGC
jgi:uncharacterized protein (DUF1684 family)